MARDCNHTEEPTALPEGRADALARDSETADHDVGMKNFTRAERSFIVTSVLTAILFLVVARLQFWGFESGIDVPFLMPVVVMWGAIAWIAFIAYGVAHRLITSRTKVEVA